MPKGHVWIQGDNIYSSFDSRTYGAVPYGLIQGKVFCRVMLFCLSEIYLILLVFVSSVSSFLVVILSLIVIRM